jgi:hypothetical protein
MKDGTRLRSIGNNRREDRLETQQEGTRFYNTLILMPKVISNIQNKTKATNRPESKGPNGPEPAKMDKIM